MGMMNTRIPALALLLACSCTRFASEFDTPDEEADTRGLGTASNATESDWTCLEQNAPVQQPIVNQVPLTYSLLAVDYVSNSIPPDLKVRACFRPDVACADPATEDLSVSADGTVKVTLYEGFNGFLEITAEGMIPALLFFPDEWSRPLLDRVEPVPIALLQFAALEALGQAANIEVEPTGGIVSINTFDCQGPAAPGVRLEIDTDAIPYAFVDDLPIPYQDTTTDEGAAGFVNVPPGFVVVTGFPGELKQPIGLETLLVRTGWVTVGSMLPRVVR
jgi:hypothetical protein